MKTKAQLFLEAILGEGNVVIGAQIDKDTWDRNWNDAIDTIRLPNGFIDIKFYGNTDQGRQFEDKSFYDIVVDSATGVTLIELSFNPQCKSESSYVPACTCDMRDLMSGPHPKNCAWLKSKNRR